jgi:hypothetical protein
MMVVHEGVVCQSSQWVIISNLSILLLILNNYGQILGYTVHSNSEGFIVYVLYRLVTDVRCLDRDH